MSVDAVFVDDLMIVERPTLPPAQCAFSLATEDPQGFIDSRLSMAGTDFRVLASVTWVKTTAKKLGMIEPDGDADKDQVFRENARLREENEELNRQLEAIDLIESRGFTARKKAGRPRKKTEEE